MKMLPRAFGLVLMLLLKICSCTQVTVVPGSSVELQCFPFQTELSGLPVSWKFNGVDVAHAPRDSVKVSASHLFISRVGPEDQGEYTCSAMDLDRNLEMTRTFSVAIEALISYSMIVGAGQNAFLPCHFFPGLKVKANALWSKETERTPKQRVLTEVNGTKSRDDNAQLLYPLDSDQTMIIREVTADDQGLYHCETPQGLKLSTIQLFIQALPTPPPHSCEGSTGPWEECGFDLRHATAVLKESLTDASFHLYSALKQSNADRNLLFSPLSISGALAYLLLGARNQTRTDLENALRLPPKFDCVHLAMKRLREELSESLQMASQIYYDPNYNISESFVAQSEDFYDSVPVKLLQNTLDNVHMINSWVANKTNNKITQLVRSVSAETRLMLLSAVSFSGMWTHKFSEKRMKADFTKLNGDIVKVPILENEKFKGSLAYVDELKAQAMRFGLTGNNSLYILLPATHAARDLQQLESRLTDAAVRHMVDQVRRTPPQRVEVILPHIKLKVEENMRDLMKTLGLSSLVEGAAFCGLYAEEPLALGEAKHKAHLTLTEKGVEAAAVTALGFSRSFLTFSAMRPFILILWSDAADVPLFIGRVTDPGK